MIDGISRLLQGLESGPALIWLGMGPGALATCLQAFGQKRLSPAQAQARICRVDRGCRVGSWGVVPHFSSSLFLTLGSKRSVQVDWTVTSIEIKPVLRCMRAVRSNCTG